MEILYYTCLEITLNSVGKKKVERERKEEIKGREEKKRPRAR